MKLLTKQDFARLPKLYETEHELDPMVQVKFFLPGFSWTWYAIEFDGKDIFYGYVDSDCPELGYFSLTELRYAKGPLGLGVERDLYFKPTRLSVIKSKSHRA